MVCGKRRLLIILATVAALTPTFMLWDATGRRTFTFFPSADLAALQHQDGSLTGVFGRPNAGPPINNTFGLGLLPSGSGEGLISVLIMGVPVLALALVALLGGGKHEVCEVAYNTPG
ncbi:MAG: hypothetical protein GC200_07900 [Tepidisphaera sp.]|nr:hypothetical protein [Tepidisphaera sp.]